MKSKIIQIKDKPVMTHFFTYNDKQYPIDFHYFKRSSQYFVDNEEFIRQNKFINLIDKDSEKKINLSDPIINDFINYIHQQPISLDNDNASLLNYLANKYKVSQLIEATEEYISSNQHEIALQILLIHQNNDLFDTKTYENIISSNFSKYIKDERLFDLNFTVLYRIFIRYDKSNLKMNDFFDFLFKCLNKYGRQASVLFDNINFDHNCIEYFDRLINEYSDKFDFHFINSEILKQIYGQQKTIIRKHIEYQKQLDNSNQKMKDEIEKLKNDYELKLSKMDNEFEKLKNDYELKLSKMDNEFEKLKNDYELKRSKMANEIDQLKQAQAIQNQHQETFLQRIEKLEQNKNNHEIESLEKCIEIQFENGKYFDGIFNYLTKITGGNIHDNKTIIISSNHSFDKSDQYHPKNLVDYQSNLFYHSQCVKNIFIRFDFKDKFIRLTSYEIKKFNVQCLRNWVIEGSNDEIKWDIIDEQINNPALNGNSYVATFSVKPTQFYRFIQLRQTGVNWHNDYFMILNALEFYGKLKLK